MAAVCGALSAGAKPKTLVALDSGAVAVKHRGLVISIDDLINFIHKERRRLTVYFNLDVIGKGPESYANWVYMRSHGVDPVPVYHYGTPIKYLQQYLRQTNYIGIGGLSDKHLHTKRRRERMEFLWSNYLFDAVRYDGVKTHGLGVTPPELLAAFPWYSVDSSSWVKNRAWGGVCLVPKYSPSAGYLYDEPPRRLSLTTEFRKRTNPIDRLPHDQRANIETYFKERGLRLGRGRPGDHDYEPGLCNDDTIIDQGNAIYYLEMGKALGKILYVAGNFEALGDPEIERRIQQAVYARGLDYWRMISFADYPEIRNVLNLKEEEEL